MNPALKPGSQAQRAALAHVRELHASASADASEALSRFTRRPVQPLVSCPAKPSQSGGFSPGGQAAVGVFS